MHLEELKKEMQFEEVKGRNSNRWNKAQMKQNEQKELEIRNKFKELEEYKEEVMSLDASQPNNWQGEWEETEITVDPGAVRNVMPPSMLTGTPVKGNEDSKEGKRFQSRAALRRQRRGAAAGPARRRARATRAGWGCSSRTRPRRRRRSRRWPESAP